MKYSRGQFNNTYYELWQKGFAIPPVAFGSIYSVKYRAVESDVYSRITLQASSLNDALERACFDVSSGRSLKPEDIDLHAVFDEDENLLWIDEPFYDLVQKKNEFRGMERREFLKRFGATSAAILYGLRPSLAGAGTINLSLGGTASGFIARGEQLYTSPGTYTWTVPAGLSSCSVVCIGGGASGGGRGASDGVLIIGNSGGVTKALGLIANGGSGGRGGTSDPKIGGVGGSSSGGNSNFSGGNGADGCTGYWMRGGGGGNTSNYSSNGTTGTAVWDCGTYTWSDGAFGAGASLYGVSGSGTLFGGGGRGFVDHYGGGGGGGAGGLCFSNSIAVTAGSSISVEVGAAGTGSNGWTGNSAGSGGGAVRIIWGSGRSFPSNAS